MSVRWNFKLQGWKEKGRHLHKGREDFHWLTVLTWHRIAGECSTNWRSVLFWVFKNLSDVFKLFCHLQLPFRLPLCIQASVSNLRVTVQQSVPRSIMVRPYSVNTFFSEVVSTAIDVFLFQFLLPRRLHLRHAYAYRKKNWKNAIHEP